MQLFGHVVVLETHNLWHSDHCCLITRILVLLLHRIWQLRVFTHFIPFSPSFIRCMFYFLSWILLTMAALNVGTLHEPLLICILHRMQLPR